MFTRLFCCNFKLSFHIAAWAYEGKQAYLESVYIFTHWPLLNSRAQVRGTSSASWTLFPRVETLYFETCPTITTAYYAFSFPSRTKEPSSVNIFMSELSNGVSIKSFWAKKFKFKVRNLEWVWSGVSLFFSRRKVAGFEFPQTLSFVIGPSNNDDWYLRSWLSVIQILTF